jgi:hypothetical protein
MAKLRPLDHRPHLRRSVGRKDHRRLRLFIERRQAETEGQEDEERPGDECRQEGRLSEGFANPGTQERQGA